MFDKDKFHNQLALNLGYQSIVNNKHITINIDEKQYPDDVMISLCVDGVPSPICYKASEGLSQNNMDCFDNGIYEEMKMIIDAVHQAYLKSTNDSFVVLIFSAEKISTTSMELSTVVTAFDRVYCRP